MLAAPLEEASHGLVKYKTRPMTTKVALMPYTIREERVNPSRKIARKRKAYKSLVRSDRLNTCNSLNSHENKKTVNPSACTKHTHVSHYKRCFQAHKKKMVGTSLSFFKKIGG
jgi:hypothetical protein